MAFLFAEALLTVSSSPVGGGTIKYRLMAPHRSSHPASGPMCVCFNRTALCFICYVCFPFGMGACISSDVLHVFHLSVGWLGGQQVVVVVVVEV